MNFKQPPSLPWAKIHSSSVQEHQRRSCHLLFVLHLHASHSVDKWQNGSHKYEPTARGAIFYVGNKSALPRVVLGEKIPSPMKVCLGELSSATFKMQPGFDSRRGGGTAVIRELIELEFDKSYMMRRDGTAAEALFCRRARQIREESLPRCCCGVER